MDRDILFLVLFALINSAVGNVYPPPCDSDIYCDGKILHTVQMAHLHKDSKHFVDMPMQHDPSVVRENFKQLMENNGQKPTKDQVGEFVQKNFREPGSEFEDWNPTDWKESPAFLERVSDADLREWMRELHSFWGQLGRQVSAEVYLHPSRFSLVYVPNPTIVPGGRFREFYYWDSYWVLKGLLLSEMKETVRGMLENFLSMVKTFGMVPNGGRVYFTRRSQPPFLIPMIQLYVEATGDFDFVASNIDLLEQEYSFWRNNRSIEVTKDGTSHTMFRYNVEIGSPRPESYREDLELAEQAYDSEETREEFQAELKSGAESGWDFSSRWYIRESGQTTPGSLKDVKTRSIIPVDLNSLVYWNARLLAEFWEKLNDTTKADERRQEADALKNSINQLLWDDETGSWYDWDNKNQKLNTEFYPSNMFPVWVGASSPLQDQQFFDYMKRANATGYASGIPTSLEPSGQQWDFPNSWPPMQHVVVESLSGMAIEEAKQLAFDEARKWMESAYITYKEVKPHAMFEKYDVTRVGLPGGGGEYDVQLGFGWTNGVAMTFADQYGDKLVAPSISAGEMSTSPPWIIMLLVPATLLATATALLW